MELQLGTGRDDLGERSREMKRVDPLSFKIPLLLCQC